MSRDNKSDVYWTPVDDFLLKIIKEYDCLAALCPRIHTPFDLVRWDSIKDSTKEQYQMVNNIRSYYDYALKENNFSDFRHFDESENFSDAPKSQNFDNLLTSHAPIFGRWMEESGFLDGHKDDKKPNQHETYDDFFRILQGSGKNRLRKALFPTFEALEEEERLVANNGSIMVSKNYKTRLETKKLGNDGSSWIYETYARPDEDVDQITSYNKTYPGFGPHDIKQSSKTVLLYEKKCPVIVKINDQTKRIDGSGFLGTPIKVAYHMNFDINGQFRTIFLTGSRDRMAQRIRDDLKEGQDNDIVVGRIRDKRQSVYEDDKFQVAEAEYDTKKISLVWDDLPLLDGNETIPRDGAAYRTYDDYYEFDRRILDITRVKHSNYFHFMYGALPANKILYEELAEGFRTNSVVYFSGKEIKWTAEEKQKISRAHLRLPLDNELTELKKVFSATILFIALNLGIYDKEYNLTIPHMRLDSPDIQMSQMKIVTLASPYPKFLSRKLVTVVPGIAVANNQPHGNGVAGASDQAETAAKMMDILNRLEKKNQAVFKKEISFLLTQHINDSKFRELLKNIQDATVGDDETEVHRDEIAKLPYSLAGKVVLKQQGGKQHNPPGNQNVSPKPGAKPNTPSVVPPKPAPKPGAPPAPGAPPPAPGAPPPAPGAPPPIDKKAKLKEITDKVANGTHITKGDIRFVSSQNISDPSLRDMIKNELVPGGAPNVLLNDTEMATLPKDLAAKVTVK